MFILHSSRSRSGLAFAGWGFLILLFGLLAAPGAQGGFTASQPTRPAMGARAQTNVVCQQPLLAEIGIRRFFNLTSRARIVQFCVATMVLALFILMRK
jgi:hypothetical protein